MYDGKDWNDLVAKQNPASELAKDKSTLDSQIEERPSKIKKPADGQRAQPYALNAPVIR